MAQRFFVITYRSEGNVFFFRGDNRYAIYLPKFPGPGWVESVTEARLFVAPPDFGPKSISKSIVGEKVKIYPYEGMVHRNNVIRPTRRPQPRKPPKKENAD
ncbi:MAG: hypothetical protein RLZZ360_509 [Candidatus Parcubacteria bacterium]|jgi:hypothetical protein